MHWMTPYIGLPYLTGGRNKKGLDCWGLMRLIYKEEKGIELPEYPGISAEEAIIKGKVIARDTANDWIPIEKPEDGCGVAMSQKHVYHHVGVWADADGGKVVHCWEGTKFVVADTRRNLYLKGFLKIAFFRHKEWPT